MQDISELIDVDFNAVEKALCTKSFYQFYKRAFKVLNPKKKYVDDSYIKDLCDMCQFQCERIISNVVKEKDHIVNISPRTSKSLIFSVCFPVWCWLRDPTLKIWSVSYSATAAIRNSFNSRRVMESEWFVRLFADNFQLRDDSNSKSDYTNNHGGFRRAYGHGSITGDGCDIMIIDDIQNAEEAESHVKRLNCIEFFSNSLISRLDDQEIGWILIVQQRLHENDLTGYLLEKMPHLFEHICLPVICNDNVKPESFKKHYKDNLLSPLRLKTHTLEKLKTLMSIRKFSAQYLQNPVPFDGEWIKKSYLEIVDIILPANLKYDFFIDTAYGTSQGDATAILCATVHQNNLYIKFVEANHLKFFELKNRLLDLVKQHGNGNSRVFVEGTAAGKPLIDELKRTSGISLIEMSVQGDKATRLDAVLGYLEAGRVKLLRGNWNEPFTTECISFTGIKDKHDDQVDTLIMAITKLLARQNSMTFSVINY